MKPTLGRSVAVETLDPFGRARGHRGADLFWNGASIHENPASKRAGGRN